MKALAGLYGKRSLFIYGAFGAGKSPFVDRLISEYVAHDSQVLWVRINFSDFSSDALETIDSLWKQIVVVVAKQTNQELAQVTGNWEEYAGLVTVQVSVFDFFDNMFKNLDRTLILVLENAHEIIDKPYVNFFFDNLRGLIGERHFSDALRIVVSMISDFEEAQDLSVASPFFNFSLGIHLSALDEIQIAQLLESYDFDNSEETIRKIKELVGGNLYLVSTLLEHTAEANQDIRQVLASTDVNRIFDSRLETLRSLISEVDGAERILDGFKEKDAISIQTSNLDKNVYDGLAKIGILNRENRETEILYSIEGNRLKTFVGDSFSNF